MGTDPTNISLAQWVVGAVAAALVSGLSFLLKRALTGLEESVKSLGVTLSARLDALSTQVQGHHTDVAVLRADLGHLEKRMERVEGQFQQMREG